MLTMAARLAFLVSLPERVVRSLFALVGGGVHETAELVLPRLVRRSRLYEATAKNLLRVSIELVGGVEAPHERRRRVRAEREEARRAQDGGKRRRARLDRRVRLLAALAPRRRGRRDPRDAGLPRRLRGRAQAGGRPRRGGAAARRSTSSSPRSRAAPARRRG